MYNRQAKSLEPIRQQQYGTQQMDRADFVIVGNGIAGLTAAVEARRLAPEKRIVVITDQIYPTINTPALKQFAIGKMSREQLLAYPSGSERREHIHIVTARVEEIHARNKYVSLNGKRNFGYDKLLIATGSRPNGLPAQTPGRDFDGVMTLHRLEDYMNLRRRMPEVQDAIVIGGGVHAIETVMGLLYNGIRVHWLIRGSTLMARMLDETTSAMVLERIRRAGAQIYTETEVAGVVGRVGAVAGVITTQREMIPGQLVLTCTGTQPVLNLAEHCSMPLQISNGIRVDDQLRTNVPDIFAAGDVAALKNPQTGKYEPRAQWYSATEQGRIAGAMLTDHVELANQPFGVHWHATHLGELSMLTVGEPLKEGGQIVTLTDSSASGYRRISISGDRLIGYLSLGKAQPDSLAIKRIIDEGHSVEAITRALLKGNFDARKYLSKLRTQEAKGIVTRKLPPLVEPSIQQLPETGEQARLPAAWQERSEKMARQTGPLTTGKLPLFEQENMDAFTGRLPELSGAYEARELAAAQQRQAEEGEFNAFTGNLPMLSGVYTTGELVESEAAPTMIPESTPEWNPGQLRKLWSYAEGERSNKKQQNESQSQEQSLRRQGLWSLSKRSEHR